jgi:pimeloyl-ACP methyl ester carboxylesterase
MQTAATMPTRPTHHASLAAWEHPGAEEPTIVLLHGLTFDHRMWLPAMEALPAGRRAVAFDLPGHGESPPPPAPGLAAVVEAVHAAVTAAAIDRPVVVGHSVGGAIAAAYAAAHPAAGVVSVDAPLRMERFAPAMRAAAPALRGQGFEQAWSRFQASFGLDLVAAAHRPLLAAGERPSQEVVLAYQADLLERPAEEVVRWRDGAVAAVAAAGIPYVSLHANPPDPEDVRWFEARLPQAEVLVWPVRHHFPHLARPAEFADLVARVGVTA